MMTILAFKSMLFKIVYTTAIKVTRSTAIADKPRDAFRDINLRKIP